jgi:hypothetical protein
MNKKKELNRNSFQNLENYQQKMTQKKLQDSREYLNLQNQNVSMKKLYFGSSNNNMN